MTITTRRTALTLLAGGLAQACTPTAPAVTRQAPDPFEGGIGGTGIVGVLTDFGSLMVNGLRVEVDAATAYASPFGPVTGDALRRGQALTIIALATPDRLVARTVRVDHPLVGTIAADGTVNGVPVVAEAGAAGRRRPGTRMAVSGVWTAQGLSASRFDAVDGTGDIVAGDVARGGPTGVTVGGVPVRLAGTAPAPGSYLAVQGRYTDGVLVAEIARSGRFDPAAGALRQLSVEGYLAETSQAPGFRVAGLGHSFGRNLRLAPLAGTRAVYFGPYDGRFQAARAYALPDDGIRRRRILADGNLGRADPTPTR